MRKARKDPYAIYAQDGKMPLCEQPYAYSEGPDECAHPCSLIWTFSVHRHILQYPLILLADKVSPDQPARMHSRVRVCVVRKLHKGPFHALITFNEGSICVSAFRYSLQYSLIFLADNEGPDQTARIIRCSLICGFIVRIWQNASLLGGHGRRVVVPKTSCIEWPDWQNRLHFGSSRKICNTKRGLSVTFEQRSEHSSILSGTFSIRQNIPRSSIQCNIDFCNHVLLRLIWVWTVCMFPLGDARHKWLGHHVGAGMWGWVGGDWGGGGGGGYLSAQFACPNI